MRTVKKSVSLLALIGLCAVLMTGCLYPEENRAQNMASTRDAVIYMQSVIDQYQQQTGVLPIKNSTPDTPKYEKYVIDLAKLQRMQYIGDLPSVSFENGGRFYFLLLDEDTKPTVKLMDLVSFQAVNDIQSWVNDYQRRNNTLPVGDEAYPGFFRIDYGALGKKEPAITSLYSGTTLSTMMDGQGIVYIDYGIDLMRTIERNSLAPEPEQDLREFLAAEYDFVPVKTTVYHWVDNEPRAMPEDKE
ncbi:hypothetical protein [Paenibacillus abyssi]|uniref:DUF3939 domain-containing protein n=1 Tax=Paenibacillus abyssi TaxID=1340531 RepID=A0A917FKD9_9BACL|nr:hypothetical protein [Paenibacillus abyssi]GGF87877.1 hypothetical protein GCM10010916_01490 [Paenibacillus abyssi]